MKIYVVMEEDHAKSTEPRIVGARFFLKSALRLIKRIKRRRYANLEADTWLAKWTILPTDLEL